MVRKTLKQEETQKKRMPITQADFVLDYLLGAGRKGATNFEMMINLQICDVRKRITELNRDEDVPYYIGSVWEENENSGARYKRYFAVPFNVAFEDFLNGKKNNASKAGRKRTNSKRR